MDYQAMKAFPEFNQVWEKTFKTEGILVIEHFFKGPLLQAMIEEANCLASDAFYKPVSGNAYLQPANPDLPTDHALNLNETTTVGVVAYDQFPQDSLIRAVYSDPDFHDLIARILNRGPLYRYDCELGALNLAVMRPGDYLRWHFDQSDFVVSIPLQPAEQGGIYQYVKNLKNEDEPNYEGVKAVIRGQGSPVQALETPPGSLIFFEGRHTLHRVTTIEGERSRLVALLGYADRPGIKSDAYLRQIRYGR